VVSTQEAEPAPPTWDEHIGAALLAQPASDRCRQPGHRQLRPIDETTNARSRGYDRVG
jgi:hypothetical protein